jgi:hypothetical protein
MSRALLILDSPQNRQRAHAWVIKAPFGTRLEFKAARRSTDQNAKMWCCLTEVASQLEWHGQKYTAEDWKDYFMHAMRRARWMPSEDGGLVPIGMRTSDLSKGEMVELIELVLAFGAEHGVIFNEPDESHRDGRLGNQRPSPAREMEGV